MDLPVSETSSLKDENTVLKEEIDEVAECLEAITLADDESVDKKVKVENSVEGNCIQVNKLVEDKQSLDGEKVESNIEVEGEFHKEELAQEDKSIEENAQSDETDRSKLSDEESNLKELLQTLQCPFTWKLEHCENPEHVLDRIIEKIGEIKEEISFQWRHFILILVLCYEYYRKKNIDLALDELKKCEEIVNNSDSQGHLENFFQLTKNALLHVVLACKCYLYLEKGDLDEVKVLLDSICKEEEMDNPCKAAIWGIRAAISMEYGYKGTKDAIDYVEEALKFDTEQAEWYFLLGKCLGRIRRIDNYAEIPKLEELKALEKAVQMSRNPSYIIFLAQAYREAAFRVFSLNRHSLEPLLKDKINGMNKRSLELYREALENQGDCSHVNIRCAQGLYKLPSPYKDVKKAKECCEKAMEMAPDNAMVHHIRGFIYDYEQDYENAKKHYKKSGELGAYGAFMDLIRLEYKMDKSYNPIPRFEQMLQQFVEKPRREETLCQMGSYYFFLKDDLPTAFRRYWHEVIKENPESDKLKTHKSTLLYMQKPVDIYELLYDEARLALKSNDSKCNEDAKILKEIILICLDICPEVDKGSPKPRRKIILDECNSRSYNVSRNRGGRGFQGQGRRRGRGEGISRNQNQGRERDDNSEGNRGRGTNIRFVPRNRSSDTDSRPGQRFNRRYESNWRTERVESKPKE